MLNVVCIGILLKGKYTQNMVFRFRVDTDGFNRLKNELHPQKEAPLEMFTNDSLQTETYKIIVDFLFLAYIIVLFLPIPFTMAILTKDR